MCCAALHQGCVQRSLYILHPGPLLHCRQVLAWRVLELVIKQPRRCGTFKLIQAQHKSTCAGLSRSLTKKVLREEGAVKAATGNSQPAVASRLRRAAASCMPCLAEALICETVPHVPCACRPPLPSRDSCNLEAS